MNFVTHVFNPRTLQFLLSLIITLCSLIEINCYSQIPPSSDKGWIYNTSLSDEFNGSLNENLWYIHNNFSRTNQAIQLQNNVTFTDSLLILNFDTLSPNIKIDEEESYIYQGAGIETHDPFYKYGFIEILAKIPLSNENGTFWPTFWFWDSNCESSDRVKYYEEIDVIDNGGEITGNGHIIRTSWYSLPENGCEPYDNINGAGKDVTTNIPLNNLWHKYGVEITPDKIVWYFNDKPISYVLNPSNPIIPSHGMKAILDFESDKLGKHNRGFLPATFEINYFRYYTLETECSNSLFNVCSINNDLRKVWKTIEFGNFANNCSPTMHTSDKYTIRATNSILLKKGTSIFSNGAGHITLLTTDCPSN